MSVVFKSGTNQFHGSGEDRFIGKSMIHRSYLEQARATSPFSYHETSFLCNRTGPAPEAVQWPRPDLLSVRVGAPPRDRRDHRGADHRPHDRNVQRRFLLWRTDQPAPAAGLQSVHYPSGRRHLGARSRSPAISSPRAYSIPPCRSFWRRIRSPRPNQAGIPSATGPTENLVMDQEKQIRRTRMDIKIDHQFTPNHKIFGRYSEARHRAWKAEYWRSSPGATSTPTRSRRRWIRGTSSSRT